MNRNPDVLDRLAPLFESPGRGFVDLLRRREKKQRARKIGAIALVTVIAATFVGAALRSGDGRNRQPADPSKRLTSDGAERLVISPEGDLIILHADETETLLRGPGLPGKFIDAAMSPDGSRVAYTTTPDGTSRLYVIDVDSGRTTRLVEPRLLDVYQPTFSPDGTQIAYIDGWGDHTHSVWVVNADGSDARKIVENEVLSEGHVFGLAWSPTGDRIALGLRRLPAAGIYTFAPDGSGFTRLISDAIAPSWSPDGSRIAYESYIMIPCPQRPNSCWRPDLSGGLGVADADGSHAKTFGLGGSGPWWHPA